MMSSSCRSHDVQLLPQWCSPAAVQAAPGAAAVWSRLPPAIPLQESREHRRRVTDLAWSQQNDQLISASEDGLVTVTTQGDGFWTMQRSVQAPTAALCCRFHPVNQNLILVGTAGGTVEVFNTSTGALLSCMRNSRCIPTFTSGSGYCTAIRLQPRWCCIVSWCFLASLHERIVGLRELKPRQSPESSQHRQCKCLRDGRLGGRRSVKMWVASFGEMFNSSRQVQSRRPAFVPLQSRLISPMEWKMPSERDLRNILRCDAGGGGGGGQGWQWRAAGRY